MQNQIQVFNNREFGELEVLTINGKLYFPATECAKVLGYSNPYKAVIDHCNGDDLTNREVIDRLGRKQEKKYISEGNLYRLIIRSKLPEAVRFEKWVFDEVLPTIRKCGAYITDELLDKLADSEEEMSRFLEALTNERNERRATEQKCARLFAEMTELGERCDVLGERIDEILPKADYYDIILQCEDAIPITIIAKDYGMTAAEFNRLLHDLGIQFKLNGTWLLYSDLSGMGYTVSKTFYIGENKTAIHTYWTQAGRKMIYDTLREYGLRPCVEVTL